MVILTSSLRTDGFLPHLRLFNSDFYFILLNFPFSFPTPHKL